MVAAHLRIAPLTPTVVLDPAVLRDLIHAQAPAGSGVEHLRVRAGPDSADILAFIDSNDPAAAFDLLHRLVSSAIREAEPLRLWRIV
ncbi:hypothetical protein [Micromonospora sp. DPT]|uniref:hypothetical protein n=1 Tax=Micromonospora sp. DPT TaxID=3142975 RepID=UPI003207B8D6